MTLKIEIMLGDDVLNGANKGGKKSECCIGKERDESTKNHIMVQRDANKHDNELRQ